MSPLLLIALLVFLLYACTLAVFGWSFRRMKPYTPHPARVPVTVIICARNEQAHLATCLRNLVAQEYPRKLVQVIVVNDASTDSTSLIADTELENTGIAYRILSNPAQQGKKRSISMAMRFAAHELVVLRDADTFAATDEWLPNIVSRYAEKPGLVIGPVAVRAEKTIAGTLQALESAALVLFTGGSAHLGTPFLCSGANLAFPREVFVRTNGYESHAHLLSGDDVFFLEDVKKLGDVPISFLNAREAVVFTYALASPVAIFRQKARWASKFRYNRNLLNRLVALLVFAANATAVAAWVGLLCVPVLRLGCLLFICAKTAADLVVLSLASKLVKQTYWFTGTVVAALLYPFYACVVSVWSLFTKPVWKDV